MRQSFEADAGLTENDFDMFRAGFPALHSQTYMSVCDKMILHDGVRANVDVFLDRLAAASANRVDHEKKIASARQKFARLMNVSSDSVAVTRNTSDGINSVAGAMTYQDDSNIVICAHAEHPNNIYPWLRLKRRGVELRIVPPAADGGIDVAAMIDAMDQRTKMVSCASVTFVPGHRTDLDRLGEACRSIDAFLLIDGVQSAGVLSHDLSSTPVDGFATSTSKALLGLYGFGFLYVSPNWIDRLEPAFLSRPAVQNSPDAHSAMGNFEYELLPNTQRFELGSYNLAGAYAADASLDLLLGLGVGRIERRVLGLAEALNEGVAALGLRASTPAKGPQSSHIVSFGPLDAGGHGFSTDPMIAKVSEYLFQNAVIHTIRRGQLRFGIHAYNNEADVARVIECVREGLKAAGA